MPQPGIDWTASADRAALVDAGWEVVEFDAVLRRASRPPGRRSSIANPAREWLDKIAAFAKLAVVGVRLTSLAELAALHGYVLEPAWRTRTPLLVESRQRLSKLEPVGFVDPDFGYAYTLERALHVATRMFREAGEPAAVRDRAATAVALDDEQRRAVEAHDGVVQVIAPAGSGKTTVLIERVRELRRRGVPAARILCTTFNTAARAELEERLASAGVRDVQARTFHSLGLWILTEEKLIADATTRSPTMNQWRRLCALALREEGAWIDPGDARAAISDIKLGLLATAAEFRARPGEREDAATIARIYDLYEEQQREAGAIDFDDQVMLAVRALREDRELRARWQGRFAQVLVDEYQDIEPAQELLVRILAAPGDGYFCVGDEDQTLYGWRRASVRRMIDLDVAYPGLERVSLAHNYRCPPEVVEASRRLIERNVVRFPKPIHPAPGRPGGDALELVESSDQRDAAALTARALAGRRRGEIVVLARTTNLLRTVALACVAPAISISAPRRVFESRGARQALEAYLRLFADRRAARPEDVALVCRVPSRGLPLDAEARVAALLADGFTFAESFAGLQVDARRRFKLDDGARVLDALAGMSDAGRFVRYLCSAGGLDEYYAEYEQTFGDAEVVELEVLEHARQEAPGKTVAQYAALLASRADALRDIRDDEHGVELATIHGAKGRQWPEVWLFACEEGRLPHSHALEAGPEQDAAGEGVEAERRLAYVAFTRARERLVVTTTETAASRFLTEAGLAPSRPYAPAAPVERVPSAGPGERPSRRGSPGSSAARRGSPGAAVPGREPRIGPDDGRLGEAVRVGLAYAMRTAPDRRVALQTAAAALEQRLIGVSTTSTKMTVAKLLRCVDGLDAGDRRRILKQAGLSDATVRLTTLDRAAWSRLASALRSAC